MVETKIDTFGGVSSAGARLFPAVQLRLYGVVGVCVVAFSAQISWEKLGFLTMDWELYQDKEMDACRCAVVASLTCPIQTRLPLPFVDLEVGSTGTRTLAKQRCFL